MKEVGYRLGADQGVHVEGQEEAVEEVVRQDVVEEFTVYNEDVVQVVQVVQVLCNQVAQLPPVFMSGGRRKTKIIIISSLDYREDF